MTEATPKSEKLEELYELIDDMKIALMTTRRPDGRLVTRPMATQERVAHADLWFVSNVDADKMDELEFDPNVNLGYYDSSSREWVSVSGRAVLTQDRAKIRELYEPDWRAWFSDEGGERDGGPDDPRIALIFVDAISAHYMKKKHGTPRTLFEIAKGVVTGERADIGRKERLEQGEI